MRTGDLAPPDVTPHPRPPDSPAAAWPGELVIALERLPQAAYVWDDDDPAVVWDATTTEVIFNEAPRVDTNGDGIADGWVAYTAGTVDGGARSVSATGQRITAAPAAGGAYGVDRSPRLPIVGGHAYTVRVTYTGAQTTAVVAQLFTQCYNAGGATTGGQSSLTLPTASVAGAAEVNITAPGDAAALRVLIRLLPTGQPNPALPMTLTVHQVRVTDLSVPAYVWDAPEIGSGFTDVWCDFNGLEVTHGEPDEHELYPPSHAVLQLRDPDGRYRKRTADGRLLYYAPGRRLSAWWVDTDDEPWWIFNGRITTWREALDGTITIDAYSGLAELAQETGADWTAGVDGDYSLERIAAIAALAVYTDPIAAGSDNGDTQLAVAPADDRPPLEAMQQAAWSDGGIVFSDADDQLVYRDRRWRNGRADQLRPVVLTDNVCVLGAVTVWEPEATDADDGVAGRVMLSNTAGVWVTAVSPDPNVDTRVRYTHPDPDLWQSVGAGQALADWIVKVRSVARMALSSAQLYLHDARFDLWALGTDLRLTDRVTWLHDDGADRLRWGLTVRTVRHAITPDAWVVDLESGPAVDYVPLTMWDQSPFTWDDPNDLNVWS